MLPALAKEQPTFHFSLCKAVTGLATFSARIVIYLMLIRRAGT